MNPKLSVVIPIYNAEPYLEECLTAVAAQDFDRLEAVLIDDGSTDRSADIARAFAARDPRFRLIRQANTGCGAARNVGIGHTSPYSDYLAFADADDLLPPSAYSQLIASLEGSGSEIAAGNVHRLDSAGSYQFEKHAQDFRRALRATTISEVPGLLMDRTVWNKVYRRDFWARHGLRFPEGMLYEDSPVTIPLYYMARRIDIVPEIVYYWRVRESDVSPSITQQRTVSAMLDRFASIDLVRGFLGREAKRTPDWLVSYERNLLREEIPLFFDELVDSDNAHRRAFTKAAAALLQEIRPQLFGELPNLLREIYSAISAGQTDRLMSYLVAVMLDPEWRRATVMATTSSARSHGSPA